MPTIQNLQTKLNEQERRIEKFEDDIAIKDRINDKPQQVSVLKNLNQVQKGGFNIADVNGDTKQN